MEKKNKNLIRNYNVIMTTVIVIAVIVALVAFIKSFATENIRVIFIAMDAVGILITSLLLLYTGKHILENITFQNHKHKTWFLLIGGMSVLCFWSSFIFHWINTGIDLLSPEKTTFLNLQMGSIVLGAVLFYTSLLINKHYGK